jgi:hypothetical protein
MDRDVERVDVERTETVAVGRPDGYVGGVDVARSDLLSWSSIVAGVLTAFGLFVLFTVIGLAAGLEAETPRFGREIGLIITGIFGLLAFAAGGFIAAWTADVNEPESAIMHGFLTWALFVVLLLAMVAAGLAGALGSAGNFFSGDFGGGDAEALSDAAWSSVFALVLAVAASILGALLGANDSIRGRFGFRSR